ncbi:unnamed protein product [Coccothraustes coccothraustes]
MKSRCDKAPARGGSAAGSAAAPPGPTALLRSAERHKYTPGLEQGGLRQGPRRGWSGFTPGKAHGTAPRGQGKPGSAHTGGAAASALSSARTVLSQTRLPLTAKRLSRASTVPGPP